MYYMYISVYRRLCFTPDGSLLITPTGIHRPPASNLESVASINAGGYVGSKSFCTHIFNRNHLSSPCISLVGIDEPSVAVRCCPRMFKLIPSTSEDCKPLISGDYRLYYFHFLCICLF